MATRLRFIVTAGPTREYLDPVRFLSNPSTGRMGFAVARAAARRGHEVVLVAGPVTLKTPKGVRRVDVVSARDMMAAVEREMKNVECRMKNDAAEGGHDSHSSFLIPHSSFLIATAAVADWRPARTAAVKLKKAEMSGTLRLVRNPDILRSVTGCRKIGFAAETGAGGLREAVRKCREKGAEMVVFNDVTADGSGFGTATNRVTFVTRDGAATPLPLMSKAAVGMRIVRFCEGLEAG